MYRVRLKGLPVLGVDLFFFFWRRKGCCSKCKKARAEFVELIAEETPHLTRDFGWWVGRICEISTVTRVAELLNLSSSTTLRFDLERMKRMLASYRIPRVKRISFDEVYARKAKLSG